MSEDAGDEVLLPAVPGVQFPVGKLTADDLVTSFLSSRKRNTLLAYRRDLGSFQEWCSAGTLADAVEALLALEHGRANEVAHAWKASMVEQRLAPSTINRRLAAIRSVVDLARRFGRVPWSLDVDNVPKRDYRDTAGTGVDGYRKLLAELDEREQSLLAAGEPERAGRVRRDRTIVVLLFALALRRHEVCQLDYDDLDFEKKRVRILGKGRYETEWVSMPPSAEEALRSWLVVRGESPGPLFVSYDPAGKGDGRLSLRSVSRFVKLLGITAEVRGARPHGLRHAAITAALNATGGDVRRVQKFSRHAKVDTVLTYDDNRKDLGGQVANLLDAKVKGGGPVDEGEARSDEGEARSDEGEARSE